VYEDGIEIILRLLAVEEEIVSRGNQRNNKNSGTESRSKEAEILNGDGSCVANGDTKVLHLPQPPENQPRNAKLVMIDWKE
jgi:hypothetical protein